jgi:ubiquinone/menaquinone biosynthesis C-methylase UbiE
MSTTPTTGSVDNHFLYRSAAERYQRNRPYFHPRVIEMIRDRLRLTQPLPRALDVGCGTGQSSVALRAIADRVVATDASPAMLSVAPAIDGIDYRVAAAEALPFGAGEFPLVTVSMAFHWFDRARFLAEASRVLAPGGWLVIYGYHYTKIMFGVPEFTAWMDQVFLRRYPASPRHGSPVAEEELLPHGLTLRDRSDYTDRRSYSAESYAQNLLTHSNVIRHIEGGTESAASAEAWILGELRTFYDSVSEREYEFSGWVSWVQKR